MKKKNVPPREPVQLHIDPTPVEPTEQYTLEDIMNEFGGWSRRSSPEAPPPEPLAESPSQPQPATEGEKDAAGTAPPPAAEQSPGEKPDLSAQTVRFAPIRTPEPEPERPEIWAYQGEVVPGTPGAEPPARLTREQQRERERAKRRELRRQRQEERRERRREKPERLFATPEEAYLFYCKPDSLRLRLLLSVLLALASSILLLLSSGLLLELPGRERLLGALMLGLMLLQSALSLDALAEGLRGLLHFRLDLNGLLFLLLLVVTGDAVFALLAARIPFCTVVSIELAVALWSRSLLRTAKYKTMKAVCSMPSPIAAVRRNKAWHEMDCIFRTPGDAAAFTAQLEMPDAATRIGRVYAPVVAGLALLLSVFTTLQSEQNFLWSWSAMLLAAFPGGLLLSYSRPFCREATRLYRYGAAVAGWNGARALAGECVLTITDQDLFPAGNVTLNGMKLFTDRSASQIIGYASAVVQTAGSGLVPLFEDMMHAQNGRHYRVDTFRRYEGGGLGAEIQGDVILMGSMGFMKLMKVRMPEGTRLKQAVYLSVNGELAAIFALNYAPAAQIRTAMTGAVHATGLLPLLATRDFMITPQFLKLRYKISPDSVEFPTVEERARLSAPEAGQGGGQGAMLLRGSFESFSAAVTGARGMRNATISSIAIAVMGGVMGLLVLCFLAILGATRAANCWNLFLYTLLWLLPEILVTGLSVRR